MRGGDKAAHVKPAVLSQKLLAMNLVFLASKLDRRYKLFLAVKKKCCSRLHYRHHHKKHFEGSHQARSPPQLTFFFGLQSSGIIDQAPQGGSVKLKG